MPKRELQGAPLTETARARRPDIPWGPVGLSVAMVAALLIGLLTLLPLYGNAHYRVGTYDATPRVAQVVYYGATYVPQGPAVAIPDEQMAAIAHTDEGYFLYVTAPANLGGGGGEAASAPAGRPLYLRNATGRYQLLARRTQALGR